MLGRLISGGEAGGIELGGNNSSVPTQFKSLTLSNPNQTSPNKTLVLKLAHSLSYFPISKIPSSCYPLCFPIPFSWFFHPSFSAYPSRLFSLNLHTSPVNEPNQTHPHFLFPFQIFLILQGFSGFFIPFWFQPYHRSSNETESNWIEYKKRKRGWKWVWKKSGKGVSPSRSLYYFLYFSWIQNQNQFDLGPMNLKRIGQWNWIGWEQRGQD